MNANQLGLDFMETQQGPSRTPETFDLPEANIVFYREFFSPEESNSFMSDLLANTAWRQEQIKWYGKPMDLPRLTAWYGDEGKVYKYSGITVEPTPWTPLLLHIKQAIEDVSGLTFNSVLLNLYRNGRDSVSWHSDDEPGLGVNPIIGSVSFGETRPFNFRHKKDKNLRFKVDLTSGSYLLMRGPTQDFWDHEIPKTSRSIGPRINLTFRRIVEEKPVERNVRRSPSSA
jgi:alkylated DNA repair dioxygenase AlkB